MGAEAVGWRDLGRLGRPDRRRSGPAGRAPVGVWFDTRCMMVGHGGTDTGVMG